VVWATKVRIKFLSSVVKPSDIASDSPALVTGGTGFLGRRIVERLLAEGRRVAVLARSPAPDLEARGVRVIRAAVEDADAVRAACAGMGTVFHVAAKVGIWGRHADFFAANVLGTQAVIDGCREHGVRRLVHTSTPSVVFNGRPLAGADESLPLTTACPAAYPLTKAAAERAVLAANSPALRTVALRPHLIWGAGDPHLVPRVLARARAGRLRIVGDGNNRVDMVHVANAADAHLLAEAALTREQDARNVQHSTSNIQLSANPAPSGPRPLTLDPRLDSTPSAGRSMLNVECSAPRPVAGRPFFITNGEPVVLWDWINGLLRALGEPPVTKKIPLPLASAAGALCEAAWRVLPLRGEPPMTRFVAAELAKDHWFSIEAARRDLGYVPHFSMAQGTAELVASLKR
jgi:nucleoside-diphosphate-sugar epimerase